MKLSQSQDTRHWPTTTLWWCEHSSAEKKKWNGEKITTRHPRHPETWRRMRRVPHKFTVHGLQLGVLLLVDFVIELLEKLKKTPWNFWEATNFRILGISHNFTTFINWNRFQKIKSSMSIQKFTAFSHLLNLLSSWTPQDKHGQHGPSPRSSARWTDPKRDRKSGATSSAPQDFFSQHGSFQHPVLNTFCIILHTSFMVILMESLEFVNLEFETVVVYHFNACYATLGRFGSDSLCSFCPVVPACPCLLVVVWDFCPGPVLHSWSLMPVKRCKQPLHIQDATDAMHGNPALNVCSEATTQGQTDFGKLRSVFVLKLFSLQEDNGHMTYDMPENSKMIEHMETKSSCVASPWQSFWWYGSCTWLERQAQSPRSLESPVRHGVTAAQLLRRVTFVKLRWVAGLVSVRIFGHVEASFLNSRTLAAKDQSSLSLSVASDPQVLKSMRKIGCILWHWVPLDCTWNLGQMMHLNCWALHWVQISSTNTARPRLSKPNCEGLLTFQKLCCLKSTHNLSSLVTLWSPDRLLPLAVLIIPKYYSQGLIPLSQLTTRRDLAVKAIKAYFKKQFFFFEGKKRWITVNYYECPKLDRNSPRCHGQLLETRNPASDLMRSSRWWPWGRETSVEMEMVWYEMWRHVGSYGCGTDRSCLVTAEVKVDPHQLH